MQPKKHGRDNGPGTEPYRMTDSNWKGTESRNQHAVKEHISHRVERLLRQLCRQGETQISHVFLIESEHRLWQSQEQ